MEKLLLEAKFSQFGVLVELAKLGCDLLGVIIHVYLTGYALFLKVINGIVLKSYYLYDVKSDHVKNCSYVLHARDQVASKISYLK